MFQGFRVDATNYHKPIYLYFFLDGGHIEHLWGIMLYSPSTAYRWPYSSFMPDTVRYLSRSDWLALHQIAWGEQIRGVVAIVLVPLYC